MVIKTYCDRCEKEIKNVEIDVFENALGSFFEKENSVSKLDEISLCNKCLKGYNKIIKKTNKEIKKFIEEK